MTFDRLLLLAIVFLLAIGLTASEIIRFRQAQTAEQLEERLEAAESDADAALKAVISPQLLASTERSVYMVVNDERHYGSAFVIDREKGVLATAAHVANDLEFEKEEQNYFVVNRHSGKRLRIRAKKIHAGYGRLPAAG